MLLKYRIGRIVFLRLIRVFDNAMLTYTCPDGSQLIGPDVAR